jgi:hypothetical protein
MSDRRHSRIAWRTSALACTLLAIALLPGARLVAGPRAADVHAEWRPFVSDAVRQQLEAQFRLEHPVKLADTYSWRYTLTDPSVANIQALVTHPAVADTHHIDRSRYTLEPTAPRMSHTVVGAADSLAALLLALAVVGAVTRTSPLLALQRGIPPVDAATAGVFRIVFGVAVLAFFATHARPTAVCRPIALGVLHGAVLDWLGGHPAFVELLTPWLLTTGVAFTVGMFTRLTYALFVAGVLLWAYVAAAASGTHPYSPLVIALVAMLPSRWGDACSVDSWLRRRRGAPTPAGAARGALHLRVHDVGARCDLWHRVRRRGVGEAFGEPGLDRLDRERHRQIPRRRRLGERAG